jgi:hypothetical protein
MTAPRTTRARAGAGTSTSDVVAGPSKPRVAVSKAKATTKKVVGNDGDDDLVKTMERALKIAEPEPQPISRSKKMARPVEPIRKSAQPAAAASTSNVTVTKPTVSRTAASSTKANTTSSAATTSKAVPKLAALPRSVVARSVAALSTLPPIEASHPWASSTASKEMNTPTLAKSAMTSINTSIRKLGTAHSAGYRYAAKEEGKEEWREETVLREVEICEMALALLRRMGKEGLLGGKEIEVERAGAALVMKMIGLGMVSLAVLRGRLS